MACLWYDHVKRLNASYPYFHILSKCKAETFLQAIATAMRLNLHANVLGWKLYSSPAGGADAAATMQTTLQELQKRIVSQGKPSQVSDTQLALP